MSSLLATFQFQVVLWLNVVGSYGMPVYQDMYEPIIQRAEDLLSKMTLNEKIYQLLDWDHFNPTINDFESGIGRIKMQGSNPSDIINFRNSMQKSVVNYSRLNIPASFTEESLHSSAAGG